MAWRPWWELCSSSNEALSGLGSWQILLCSHKSKGVFVFLNTGEHFTEIELAECLTTLLGVNPEGGRGEVGDYNPTGTSIALLKNTKQNSTELGFMFALSKPYKL